MEDIEFIKTSDSDLATVLYCLGLPIDGIFYSGVGDRMEFYFKNDDRLQKAMLDYSLRRLRLEPKELFDTRREIIARVKHEESLRKSKEAKRK